MTSKLNIPRSQLIPLAALATVAIPILVILFILITTGKDSLQFKASPFIGTVVSFYYLLLLGVGIVWLVKKIMTFTKLKNETIKNELQLLQGQVNPHFFFNVLNNLYGLVGKDTKKAQQLILKLSDMMRYSIYDGQKKMVSIIEEVDYLKNYIELHQMRYHKNIDIKFETNIEEEQLQILPLMFIILVENAFKHGVEHLRANAYVHITLNATEDTVYFSIENNFDKAEVSKQKGIGLGNLKKRLKLVYPKKHTLSSSQIDTIYKIQLTLDAI